MEAAHLEVFYPCVDKKMYPTFVSFIRYFYLGRSNPRSSFGGPIFVLIFISGIYFHPDFIIRLLLLLFSFLVLSLGVLIPWSYYNSVYIVTAESIQVKFRSFTIVRMSTNEVTICPSKDFPGSYCFVNTQGQCIYTIFENPK
jgi:hypothetical protein